MNKVELKLTKDEILDCLKRAKEEIFIDNLRSRTEIVKLDSKIRGYMGEKGLVKWFEKNGILFSKINHLEDSDSMDLDLVFEANGKEYILEVKTSLIPDIWNNLQNCIDKADIKLIKRDNDIKNLKGDFHLQIYFNKLRKERDNFLNSIEININEDLEKIYEDMELEDYRVYFVSWKDKVGIMDYINSLIEKNISPVWSFAKRDFWKCPINKIGNSPLDLIIKLKDLKNEK